MSPTHKIFEYEKLLLSHFVIVIELNIFLKWFCLLYKWKIKCMEK